MLSGSITGLFFQVVPITCLVGLIYAFFRYGYLKKHSLSVIWKREVVQFLLVCYIAGLFNLVLTPNNLWTAIWFYVFNGYSGSSVGPLFAFNFNFVPTLYLCLRGDMVIGSWVKTMLIGNVLMYMPLGIFLPCCFKKLRGRRAVLAFIAVPAAIEIIQPVIGRSFDVDDIVMNFIGALLGYLLFVLFTKKEKLNS